MKNKKSFLSVLKIIIVIVLLIYTIAGLQYFSQDALGAQNSEHEGPFNNLCSIIVIGVWVCSYFAFQGEKRNWRRQKRIIIAFSLLHKSITPFFTAYGVCRFVEIIVDIKPPVFKLLFLILYLFFQFLQIYVTSGISPKIYGIEPPKDESN